MISDGSRAKPKQSTTKQPRFCRVPLRQVLVVPFVVQVALAVGLTGYFSLRNGQRAVDDLADRLLINTSERINQYLNSYLAAPLGITQVNANLLERGILPATDLETIGQHFWQQSLAHPGISYIGLALPDGQYIGAGNWLEGHEIVVDQTQTTGQTLTYGVDEAGQRTEVVYEYEYFPTEEAWYQRAIASADPIWDVSVEYVEPSYISAGVVQALRNEDGELIGVQSADLILSDISATLDRLNPSENGHLLILEQDGDLVANADATELLVEQGDEIRQRNLAEVDAPVVQTIAHYIDTELGGLAAITEMQSFSIGRGRDRHFVKLTPWRDERGLDWVVVLAIPEADFMAQIYANTRTTVYLCLAALAIAILLGWYTARWIARPIERFNRASAAIALGDLNQTIPPQRIREMDLLATGFNHMSATLNQLIYELEAANSELEDRVERRTAELRRTLDQLQTAQLKLVQTEKMSSLSQLVAGVAHEINNPIGVISGNLDHAATYANGLLMLLGAYEQALQTPSLELQHLRNELDVEFVRTDFPRLLSSMQASTNRIRDIVLSLRNFSRLDEATVKRVNLHEGLDSALMILTSRLRGLGNYPSIQVNKTYGELPLVECHPSQINQVLLNLLNNAIDAIHHRVDGCPNFFCNFIPTLDLQTHCLDEHWVQVQITDNGSGIADSIQSKLFDPFFSSKPVGSGTGLGLFVSYQIVVELHGGELTFTSKPGEGSTFFITLPINLTEIPTPPSLNISDTAFPMQAS